eukprot:TRINITY_DN73304_c0_g1_i1.p1 TRINITY_DN73304_c0_g1~~TRINITY_DN73304_c0_g1_i1.p1  ORF type:complete len:261 (-),score=78.99 TRINITY_DN73304_c0_g1_i1:92-874(-)
MASGTPASAAGEAGLAADIAEMRRMLSEATRPNVRKELERVLAKLEAEQAAEAAKASKSAAAASEQPKAAKAPEPAAANRSVAPKEVVRTGPWTEITTFALDLGGYDKPNVTVDVRLKALSAEAVTCDFTESSFDLKVVGLDGANYRMIKTNLDKDIVPANSSVRVKKNHVIVSLEKVKGQYGYDSWADLCAKGKRRPAAAKSEDPSQGIMSMMKDLYDDGDDNMKRIIGEAMTKANRGEKYEPQASDLKMPGGGLDEMM